MTAATKRSERARKAWRSRKAMAQARAHTNDPPRRSRPAPQTRAQRRR